MLYLSPSVFHHMPSSGVFGLVCSRCSGVPYFFNRKTVSSLCLRLNKLRFVFMFLFIILLRRSCLRSRKMLPFVVGFHRTAYECYSLQRSYLHCTITRTLTRLALVLRRMTRVRRKRVAGRGVDELSSHRREHSAF